MFALLYTGLAVFLTALGILGAVYVKTRDAKDELLKARIALLEHELRVLEGRVKSPMP